VRKGEKLAGVRRKCEEGREMERKEMVKKKF
jgi:hypothetical protein